MHCCVSDVRTSGARARASGDGFGAAEVGTQLGGVTPAKNTAVATWSVLAGGDMNDLALLNRPPDVGGNDLALVSSPPEVSGAPGAGAGADTGVGTRGLLPARRSW